MSTRLDHILSFVQEIELRSNRLLNVTSSSIDLINSISYINQRLLQDDQDIEEIKNLMDLNRSCLAQLNALNERSFYFESNLHFNDKITNQTAFENLTLEYSHVLKKLSLNDRYMGMVELHNLPATMERDIDETDLDEEEIDLDLEDVDDEERSNVHGYSNHFSSTPTPPDIKKMISISNLRLKPMRCATTTTTTHPSSSSPSALAASMPPTLRLEPRNITKKKSRYRLSSIYNINPIAYEDLSSAGTTATYSVAGSSAESLQESDNDSERMMKNSLSRSYETLETHMMSHISPHIETMVKAQKAGDEKEKRNKEQEDSSNNGSTNDINDGVNTKKNNIDDGDITENTNIDNDDNDDYNNDYNDDINNNDDDDDDLATPRLNPENISTLAKHQRSNSDPTDFSMNHDDLLKEFSCERDYLQFNRLKHFISMSQLPHHMDYQSMENKCDEFVSRRINNGNDNCNHGTSGDDNFEYNQEDTFGNNQKDVFFGPLCCSDTLSTKFHTPRQLLEHNEADSDIYSMLSDVSYYSPEKQDQVLFDEGDDGFNKIYNNYENNSDNNGSMDIDNFNSNAEMEFDTFNRFLRKLATNLNETYKKAFPHLFRDSKSHMQPENDASANTADKFHNPITNLGASHVLPPTLDSVFQEVPSSTGQTGLSKYSSMELLNEVILRNSTNVETNGASNSSSLSSSLDSFNFLVKTFSLQPPALPPHQTSQASNTIAPSVSFSSTSFSSPAKAKPLNIPSKNTTCSSFPTSSSIFNSYATKSQPSTAATTSEVTTTLNPQSPPSSPSSVRNKLFLNFVNSVPSSSSTSLSFSLPNYDRINGQHLDTAGDRLATKKADSLSYDPKMGNAAINCKTKPPTPQKIKELKKQRMFKNIPILIPNETHLKRIPPQGVAQLSKSHNSFRRTDGTFSNLTIRQNQKYINHSDASIFNHPVMKSYNENALREALSASLLD
ncbi:hypothetical protein LELG_00898 [Lodderomyces elongisporus NRRL YB-4239]|uniref:Uncharacterized protein n=1 Tax=Lodderomyces elongisporus (strain ATCC 11503 / CBS 2605 / JCM 1781 / NBRC 1676 / NRRL YB-4239) TaxID=379508 RepID=A5DU62_LODEL|nr:hypothetical protein LELG_00898 [Lodderomyces elongisporus NRRL YB-4239]